MKIKQNLADLGKKTSNAGVKRLVESLQTIIANGEVNENEIADLCKKQLAKYVSEDREVSGFMSYLNNKEAVKSLKLDEALEGIKKTKIYESEDTGRLKDIVSVFEDSINAGMPEYALVGAFENNMKDYKWNKLVCEAMRPMESNIQKYKSFMLVQEAIDEIEEESDELNEDMLRKLDYAFYLPENHVRHYVGSILEKECKNHPTVAKLLENLSKIDQSMTSRVTSTITAKEGRVQTMQRVAPILVKEDKSIVPIGSRFLEIGRKSVRVVENHEIAKGVPTEFVELCELFKKFENTEDGLKIKDEMTEYTVAENDEKPEGFEVKVDGQPQPEDTAQEALENMAAMGTDPMLLNMINQMGSQMRMVAAIDNIVTLLPANSRATIDIIKCGDDGIVFVNVCDPDMATEQLYPVADANLDVVSGLEDQYGVQIKPYLTEGIENVEPKNDEESEEEKAKMEEMRNEFDEKTKELEEVNRSIEQIESLDEEYRDEQDIKSMYDEMKAKRLTLEEEVNHLDALLNNKVIERKLSKVVEMVYENVEHIRKEGDFIAELEGAEEGAVCTKCGDVINVDENTSVVPVVDFEKTSEGNKISGVYLQTENKTFNESDDVKEKLMEMVGESGYAVLEDGYIALCQEMLECDQPVPDVIKEDIAKVCEMVSELDNDGVYGKTDEGIGSFLKSGIRKLAHGDNSLVS